MDTCKFCSEPLKTHWTMCPVCEVNRSEFVCPGCGTKIKSNWRLCPECHTRILCPECLCRLPEHKSECSAENNQIPVDMTEPLHEFTESLTGMEFIFIPGGDFLMGDASGDGVANESPVHEVELNGFYLGKTLVTQGDWEAVMGDNPSRFKSGSKYPVEQISFSDICKFIEALEEKNNGAFKFHLPSEAEWEYAARSGGKDDIYAGSDEPDSVAWYGENSTGRTQAVCTKKPNGFGLFDMSGNVWEWCRDTYRDDAYKLHDGKNPVINDNTPDLVARGGSWNLDAWSVRCTRRFPFAKDSSGSGLGFRLVVERVAKS